MTNHKSPCGLLLLNKPQDITSQGAVSRVRRLLGVKTAGHTGTLDPLATGVLPVLVGRAVKASEYLTESDKHYSATLRLGFTTDTEDITGKILTENTAIPEEADVIAAAHSFIGETMQIPPMYSAIRVGGRRLMELARQGFTVEREARPITVKQLNIFRLSNCDYKLDVVCSKGTYIRTLCADIGAKLGCGGIMATLERTEAAGFPLQQCHTIEELDAMTFEERISLLIETDKLFPRAQQVFLAPFFTRLARNGQEIYLSKINVSFPLETKIRLYDNSDHSFFAYGEVRQFESGPAIKPLKQF